MPTLKYADRLAIAGIAAGGAVLVLYSTQLGIGTGSDSPIYLMAARNFLTGKGLALADSSGGTVPLTAFPPLLSGLLAALGWIGLDPAAASRWLNALLFAAAIAMVGSMVRRYTGSGWAAAFAALLTAATVDVLHCYCVLLSEPLFVFFVLSGLLLVMLYLERPSLTLLVLFSAAFGLAGATRYAGASLLPVGAGAILVAEGPARRRWMHCGAFLAIFAAPVLLWMARNMVLAGNLWGRTVAFHPPGPRQFVVSYMDLSTWLLPSAAPGPIRVAVLAGLIALLCLPFLKRFRGPRRPVILQGVLLAFLASYVLVFIVAQTYVDAQAWIVRRHLLAIYLAGSMAAVCAAKIGFERMHPYGRFAAALVCMAMAGLSVARTAVHTAKTHREGIGFASRKWQNSRLAAQIRELDPLTPLISNSDSAVYLLTGRQAQGFPSRVDPQSGLIRPQYETEMARIRHKLEHQNGVIVWFTGFGNDQARLSRDGLEKQLGLQTWSATNQGILLSKAPARRVN